MRKVFPLVVLPLVVLLTLTSFSGSAGANQGRVTNGTVPTNPMDDWPFVVALVDKSSRGTFCSGTLVAPRWILTAAHCLAYKDRRSTPRNTAVAIGAGRVTSRTRIEGLARVISHPGFSYSDPSCLLFLCWGDDFVDSVRHDIGLLKLRRAVRIPPAILEGSPRASSFMSYEGYSFYMNSNTCTSESVCPPENTVGMRSLEIAGYGSRCYDCVRTGVLLEGKVGVLNDKTCEMSRPGAPARNIICTQYGRRWTMQGQEIHTNVCSGDSGGPLILQGGNNGIEVLGKRILVGVASFSACERGPSSGFFSVRPYFPWIIRQMRTR